MKCSSIIACAIALLVSGSRVLAFSGPEPKGFDKVKFGASIDAVRKAYPKMETPDFSKKALNHPKIQRFFVPKMKLAGLDKPVDVDLQFWSGKFWLGQIHFGDNDQAKVDAYIKKHYGAADYQDDNYMTWKGKTAAAVLTKRQKTFEVHDEGMSNEARAELFKGKMVQSGVKIQMTPVAAPTAAAPAATPAK